MTNMIQVDPIPGLTPTQYTDAVKNATAGAGSTAQQTFEQKYLALTPDQKERYVQATSQNLQIPSDIFSALYGTGGNTSNLKPTPTTTTGTTTPTTTTTTGTTPKATTQTLTQFQASQATNPKIPNSAVLNPVLQSTNEQQLQSTGQLMNANGQNTLGEGATPQVTANQGQAATTNPNDATQYVNPVAGQYDPTKIGDNAAQGTSDAMAVNKNATVQGQLENLYNNMKPGEIPVWAQAATNTVNEVMAARGLKANSSISATALYGAVQNSAINIAASDANTYFQADMASYNAKQQTSLQNLQNRQQALLSDQAADNASKQFNAASESQVQQFMAGLVATINNQNADRIQAMGIANNNNDLAAKTFNSQQTFARQQFNAQQQFAIDQSNVLWRRELNTANTAAVNAANQFNVQNAFNISQTAMNNLWQQLRDEASWAHESAENQKDRDYNMAIISNNMSFIDNMTDTKWYEQLGGLAASILFKS